jgi:RNA cap guanine-N2 methyltransferase
MVSYLAVLHGAVSISRSEIEEASNAKQLAGPGYRSDDIFNLNTMQPYSLDHIFQNFSSITTHLVLYLPRTSDLGQLAECVEDGKKGQVVHYCTKASSRALCAYLGDFQKLPSAS